MAQIPATITGNLTGEVFLRELPGGARVSRFRVAASRSYRDKANNWQSTDLLFITVDCWNQLADNAKQSLAKGMPIIAVGTLVTNEWVDGDNTAHQQILLRANHVGVDMNRHVVSSVPNGGGKMIEGVPAPKTGKPEPDHVMPPRDEAPDQPQTEDGMAAPLTEAPFNRGGTGAAVDTGTDGEAGGERELVGVGATAGGDAAENADQNGGGEPPF